MQKVKDKAMIWQTIRGVLSQHMAPKRAHAAALVMHHTTAMAGYKRDTTLQTPRPVLELLGVVTFVFLITVLVCIGIPISILFGACSVLKLFSNAHNLHLARSQILLFE